MTYSRFFFLHLIWESLSPIVTTIRTSPFGLLPATLVSISFTVRPSIINVTDILLPNDVSFDFFKKDKDLLGFCLLGCYSYP